MSAKSLGTLVMIYATDELQNPLPLKAMLCEGAANNPILNVYRPMPMSRLYCFLRLKFLKWKRE